MTEKEFADILCDKLTRDIPLDFKVIESGNNEGTFLISVEVPDDYKMYFNIPNTYIGIDEVGDLFEVYVRIGENTYMQFDRVKFPDNVYLKLRSYLEFQFRNIIKKLQENDFIFSMELNDFLKYNKYNTRRVKRGEPHLSVVSDNIPESCIIEFSENNGDVFVDMYKVFPKNESGEESRTFLYQSSLNRENQKKVFSDFLSILKKEL